MKKYCLLLLVALLSLASCADLDEVNSRLDRLEADVRDLQSAIEALQRAYNDGKIISRVDPIDEGTGGWKVTFSDASTIRLINGADGHDGVDGKDGVDGEDGRDGQDGRDGHDGEDGHDGADGHDGVDGVTPYLMVDQDGYWCVSYDKGATFSRLMDNQGNPIKAQGPQGEQGPRSGQGEEGPQGPQGPQGEQGDPGPQGERGEDGVSIRVTANAAGYYVFQMYQPAHPDVVVDSLVTPYPANRDMLITAISEDDVTHEITLTLGNGQTYVFNKTYTMPTSIAILATSAVKLGKGTMATLEFRVNPSNALFNYDLASDQCQISLDKVGTATRAGIGYVTPPTNYRLTRVTQVFDERGVKKTGQYKAYLADAGTSTDYDELAALVLTLTDARGEEAQVSSSAFEVRSAANLFTEFGFRVGGNKGMVTRDTMLVVDGNNLQLSTPYILDASHLVATFRTNGSRVFVGDKEQVSGITVNDFTQPVIYRVVSDRGEENVYTVSVNVSGFPIMYLNTPGSALVTSKDEWLEHASIEICDDAGLSTYRGEASIRGRGNTTWGYPKKPYTLKLDQKAKLLGMPSDKRWVLLANWMDRTLLRNAVAFEIARQTSLAWTPRGRFVELVMNGRHVGNYYLCEKIKADKNRVNIHKLKATDTHPDSITGGYLLEVDQNFDRLYKFRSERLNLPYMFHEPDDDVLTQQQFDYMHGYINAVEQSLVDEQALAAHEYERLIDVQSFIDWWIVNELAMNGEPSTRKSSYMYKDRGGLLTAGPVWDFDYYTFVPEFQTRFLNKWSLYYGQLFKDPAFVAQVKSRWLELRPRFDAIPDYTRQLASQMRGAADMNNALWPINIRVNGDELMEYDEAVERLIDMYQGRLKWLDSHIAAL